MAKKQINVRVDEAVYVGIEERAAAAGMEVNEYARQLLADEANDLRHRFLVAGDHFVGEPSLSALGETFRFGGLA
ncbi:hypothetical protein OG758_01945 [Streptomyces sp. NBC_01474]|uniref:plasmid mobilization protein n=1 Tax=Streptomyces sp. NBC_01474 TaxID=2903880 RepID=UPI002DDA8D3A|nr:hypothetical protein [Streptomyces sp. NBC_01474]WSD93071.1 hypothetical protein OG758_01945 [Streptomyces sp. NBC_01474]